MTPAQDPNQPLGKILRLTLDGKPVAPNAFVQLRRENGSDVYGGQISDKGEFQISEPIKAGSYEILVFNIAASAIVSSITRDTLPAIDGNRIEITGSGAVQLDIKLSRGLGRVEGSAQKDGKPFPGAMILLVPDDFQHHPSLVRRDQSDADGTFVLRSAAPGKYKIVALRNGWDMEWSNPAVLKPYLKTAESLEIAANQKYVVKVAVQ